MPASGTPLINIAHYMESGVMEDVHSLFIPAVRDVLRHAAIAQDRVTEEREPYCKQTLWERLLAGWWSILDVFSASGMRYVIAYKNPEDSVALRALPERDRVVLELALAGRSGKWIALELQLSESTVARAFRRALCRLGVADTTALMGIKNALFESLEGLAMGVDLAMARLTPVAPSAAVLSDAERDVVAGILRGKRAAAIARERGTSIRTVAKQITSIYKKLGASSRREALLLLT
jgi:DNA-binding NarL/FixJ family response regulator